MLLSVFFFCFFFFFKQKTAYEISACLVGSEMCIRDREYPVEKALEDFLGCFHVEGEYANYCGLYGYTSFNAVRYFENIPVKDSREATNDAPDMLYILYQYLIVFNDFKNEMVLLEMLAPGEESELDTCLLYTSPSPRDRQKSRMPSSA